VETSRTNRDTDSWAGHVMLTSWRVLFATSEHAVLSCPVCRRSDITFSAAGYILLLRGASSKCVSGTEMDGLGIAVENAAKMRKSAVIRSTMLA